MCASWSQKDCTPPQSFVFQYYFWVTLFLLFFTSVIRRSAFGFVYLLLTFYMLYRGQRTLTDRRAKRLRRYTICQKKRDVKVTKFKTYCVGAFPVCELVSEVFVKCL